MPLSKSPTERFSDRVDNYIRYRPGYPAQILDLLRDECGLSLQSVVADIGSGTGILTELFLANKNKVLGIEPNREMRQAGERLLAGDSRFESVAGTAEATTLPDTSVDLIVAAQAFHWFDRQACRKEFLRILRPAGWVVLIWNDRRIDSTPFLKAYEQLLRRYATDYDQVNHKRIDEAVLREFFRTTPAKRTFPNYQRFDYAGLQGRLLSSSYVPAAGAKNYEEMLAALQKLFSEHERERSVTFEYDTLVYYGQLR